MNIPDNGYAVSVGADFLVSNGFVIGAQCLHHRFDNTGADLKAKLFQIRATYKF